MCKTKLVGMQINYQLTDNQLTESVIIYEMSYLVIEIHSVYWPMCEVTVTAILHVLSQASECMCW